MPGFAPAAPHFAMRRAIFGRGALDLCGQVEFFGGDAAFAQIVVGLPDHSAGVGCRWRGAQAAERLEFQRQHIHFEKLAHFIGGVQRHESFVGLRCKRQRVAQQHKLNRAFVFSALRFLPQPPAQRLLLSRRQHSVVGFKNVRNLFLRRLQFLAAGRSFTS